MLLLAVLLLGGCDNMQHQDNPRPFDASVQSPGQSSARTPPVHAVRRDAPDPSTPAVTGRVRAGYVTSIPRTLTLPFLQHGRERFNIYCAPCHGEDGYGRGIVVRRGFPAPASFHAAAQRALPAGRYFEIITRGTGTMAGMADRLTPDDRWAVIAYIRALQRSQHAAIADVPPARLRELTTP
jgi:cytochrome c553